MKPLTIAYLTSCVLLLGMAAAYWLGVYHSIEAGVRERDDVTHYQMVAHELRMRLAICHANYPVREAQ